MGKSEKLAPPEVDCEAMIQTRNGVSIHSQYSRIAFFTEEAGGIELRWSKRHEKGQKKKRLGYPKGEANVERMLPLHCLLVERRIVRPAEQTQQEEHRRQKKHHARAIGKKALPDQI